MALIKCLFFSLCESGVCEPFVLVPFNSLLFCKQLKEVGVALCLSTSEK